VRDPDARCWTGGPRRGDVRRLHAAVLLTDLRGFSAKTESWSEAQLLDALNRYFETVGDAVTAFGGEVLKFMGDGVLSVFPIESEAETQERCRGAAAALDRARAGLEVANRGSAASLAEPLDFVAVLHVGALSYGNIGARDRLDFTVVGPAVNIASRIEPLAKALGEKALATAPVARHLDPKRIRSIGEHALRGVPHRVELYAL
jgi:adenylate cyclase